MDPLIHKIKFIIFAHAIKE